MADFDTPVTGFQISHFGVDPLEALGITSKAQEKAQVVQDQKAMKSLTHGSPEQLQTFATGIRADNDLAQSQAVQDALTLNPADYVGKYGQEAYQNLYRLQNSIQGLEADKAQERSAGEVVSDTAFGIAGGVNQALVSAAALGASAYDTLGSGIENIAEFVAGKELYDYAPIADDVVRFGEQVQESNAELRSPVQQFDMQQRALESALNQDDSERQEDRDRQRDNTFVPGVTKFGRDLVNELQTYLDNPAAASEVVAQGAASLIPLTAGARALAATNVLKTARAGGMGDAAAQS